MGRLRCGLPGVWPGYEESVFCSLFCALTMLSQVLLQRIGTLADRCGGYFRISALHILVGMVAINRINLLLPRPLVGGEEFLGGALTFLGGASQLVQKGRFGRVKAVLARPAR